MAHWTQTYTGRKFVIDAPTPDMVCIEDIAHALSLQCRFNGHCTRFYSVADHSIRVSHIVPPEFAMQGLLHDAAEAYIGDMVRPLKDFMPKFKQIESRIMLAIGGAFGLTFPFDPSVKRADNVMLATEARDLMAVPPDDWHLPEKPAVGRIVPMPPDEAERKFLARFYELGGDHAPQS